MQDKEWNGSIDRVVDNYETSKANWEKKDEAEWKLMKYSVILYAAIAVTAAAMCFGPKIYERLTRPNTEYSERLQVSPEMARPSVK